MRGLTGKIAVIAGGGSGIGAATAVRLAEEGASVLVGDLNGANAQRVAGGVTEAGGSAASVAFDISTEAGADALIGTAVDLFGGVDLVHVNAADMSRDTLGRDSDLESVPLEVFDRTMAVDLRGHVLVSRRAMPELLARGGGAVVFTSSYCAFGGEPERPSYAMAKSGMLALVRHIASRYGREGVRANAIAPGTIVNERQRAAMTDEWLETYLSMTRSPRLGRPDDVAALVAFLLSDDGEWINGQTICVDGGTLMR
jgi:NAD(P)-dependent dehydrogenase (short-subunit alcohol dehydrogenase family)